MLSLYLPIRKYIVKNCLLLQKVLTFGHVIVLFLEFLNFSLYYSKKWVVMEKE